MAKGKVREGRFQGGIGLFLLELLIFLDKKTIPQRDWKANPSGIPSLPSLDWDMSYVSHLSGYFF